MFPLAKVSKLTPATATIIDIKSLPNRLLKVCYVPTTSAGLSRLLFLWWPLTVLMKQTRQAVRTFKQSILLRFLWQHVAVLALAPLGSTTNIEMILSLLCRPKWPRQVQQHRHLRIMVTVACCCCWHFYLKNIINVHKTYSSHYIGELYCKNTDYSQT